MNLFYKVLDIRENISSKHGLVLTVRQASSQDVRVQRAGSRCIRLAIHNTPFIWTRIEDDFNGYQILRAAQLQQISVLPPISFSLVRQFAKQNASHLLWAKTYAEMLANSSACPLTNGRWFLGQEKRLMQLEPPELEQIVQQQTYGYVRWDFGKYLYPVALRVFSSPEHGRVKAWRKFAKAACLPPILLYWVSVLDAYVILDGHDRILAAYLERVAAPVLLLHETHFSILSQSEQHKIVTALENAAPPKGSKSTATDRVNRVLQDAFALRIEMPETRGRLLKGGLAQWKAEVQAELEQQGLQETGLLQGL